MTDIAIQQYLQDFAAGVSQTFTASGGDYIKARAQTPNPQEDSTGQVPLKISINSSPEIDFIVGINYKPDQRITKIRVRNPNAFAVRANFTIGRGDITDDLVIFDGTGGTLPVALAEDAQVRVDADFTETHPIHTDTRIDTEYHDTRPIKTTNSEIQRFEQRNPNQVIDRASGRVIMPPRARSLRNAALMTGGLRERGAYNWHNGIRGDNVAVNVSPSIEYYSSFYTPEFVGQARVFGRNPTRKKLTIKAIQHGLLVSRVPFVLPRPLNQRVFASGELRYDSTDEYADAVLCVLGGFRPSTMETFNPFQNSLGDTAAGRPNTATTTFPLNAEEVFECDIANAGGLVNGNVLAEATDPSSPLNTGFTGYQSWGLVDTESDAESSDADFLSLLPSASLERGIYVNAGGTMWLQEGDEMVIEDHAPVYCLGCDSTLPSSTDVVNTLYRELSQFTWTEEFYATSSLTG